MKPTVIAGTILLGLSVAVLAQSNVDTTNKHAWGENVGWTNWRDADATNQGVVIGGRVLAGHVWGENVGWINLGDGTPGAGLYYGNVTGADFGVNIAPDGSLTGWGWGENVGWINFNGGALATPAQPANITCDGRLHGYAWGENVGWLNLDDAARFVSLQPAAVPVACDMNHDGLVDGQDVQVMVNLLLSPPGPNWLDLCSGDLAAPFGLLNSADVNAFVSCLLN